ncbi:MAG TPA: 2-oxoglutarate and iron-dependent oxygenase domain-containing protein [Stellaceae bacterium]|nr:2-oxoglutarate and iron-dependent oxygenase domain-containing protein [Stellaceae bacterium]
MKHEVKGTAFERIPLVDIAPLLGADGEAKKRVAQEMGRAASEVGFLYVTGHGLGASAIERLLARAAAFFALPQEVKQQYYIGLSRAHRGYVPPGEERFSYGAETRIDRKEAFDLSIDLPADDPDHLIGYRMLGPNQWPREVPGFREDVGAYYGAVTALGRRLFQGFALALDLEEDYFDRYLTKPPSQLRLVHYPATPNPATNTDWGISPHTDYECFTILHATTPGLEVVNAAGQWIEAPPLPGAFVINIGDMMEALTNGRFIATPHRVRTVPQERYSFPLFCSLDYRTVIEPLPQCVRPGEAPRYPRFVAGDHLLAQTMRTFTYLRNLIAQGRLALPAGEEAQGVSFGRKSSR